METNLETGRKRNPLISVEMETGLFILAETKAPSFRLSFPPYFAKKVFALHKKISSVRYTVRYPFRAC